MKKILVPACGLLLVVGALAPAPAYADSAPADPTNPRTPPTVTADALPTVQINGVVWDQEVVGNTVYAVGEFTSARPAGAAAGQQQTPRANVLAYRLDTGELIKEFAPTANGVVKTVTASPDGKLLYLGGSFTQINGETRNRIAALNPTTGAVDANFRPVPDSRVNAIVTDGKTVYFGGWFSAVGNQPRGGLAAVDARSGELRPWTPVADGPVDSMVISPDGSKVVVGGDFERLNNSSDPGTGMGALSTADGSLQPWKVGSTVRNGVGDGGISALSTDGKYVYGTGWTWLRNSNFEGTFKASWADGSIEWLEDCHGDSYDVVPHAGAVYVANHAHNCESLGEFTDSNPRTFYRANAFSEKTTGVLGSTRDEYFDFSGNPAPSMLNWFPDLEGGSYTGQYQAAWTAEAAGDYVVMGGEFPRVNGKGQQGLVRFSTRAKAPNAVGPTPGGVDMGLSASSHSGGTVSLTWTAASDQDNENLTYRIVRDGNTAQPVGEVKGRHRFYNRARMGYTDTTAQAGKQHSYQVVVADRRPALRRREQGHGAGDHGGRRRADRVHALGAPRRSDALLAHGLSRRRPGRCLGWCRAEGRRPGHRTCRGHRAGVGRGDPLRPDRHHEARRLRGHHAAGARPPELHRRDLDQDHHHGRRPDPRLRQRREPRGPQNGPAPVDGCRRSTARRREPGPGGGRVLRQVLQRREVAPGGHVARLGRARALRGR